MRQFGRAPLTHFIGGRTRSVYADLRVPGSHRALKSPRYNRHHRPRLLAWAGLTAFNRNRFYEIDRFYKARIDYPMDAHWPDMKTIDPDNHSASLRQRLDAEEAAAKLDYRVPVDIGLPFQSDEAGGSKEELAEWSKRRAELEADARHRRLRIDVDAANEEARHRPLLLRQAAEYYQVFAHLFHEDAFFHPLVPLEVTFETPDGFAPVLYGNLLKPEQAQVAPLVEFEPRPEDANAGGWCLMAVNPDGNPFQPEQGLLHWMVANIPPSGEIERGQELVPWLQPLPFQGTGYHRLVFTLFRQDHGALEGLSERWKLAEMASGSGEDFLLRRGWDQRLFVKAMEEEVTPAGLAFGQTDYDLSVKRALHQKLGMEEPVYDYEWPSLEPPKQDEWPWDPQPFHKYLDAYIPKEVAEERLLRDRLKLVAEAKPGANPQRPEFPNLMWDIERERTNRVPFLRRRRERTGTGAFRALYENRIK